MKSVIAWVLILTSSKLLETQIIDHHLLMKYPQMLITVI